MDACTSCGGRLDDCNESQVVCPWCGEPDCGPGYWITAARSNLTIPIGIGMNSLPTPPAAVPDSTLI